ncbi:hypothetical protein HY213_01015 [Candidatus Peregrinibacteria bacterium]|nr:hypothetical protein [Candidatus Peregrinibacteria bacterium]
MLSTPLLIFAVILVGAIALTAVMHAVLGVVYVPTPRDVADAMVEAAHLRGDETVYDLGAGDGQILLRAKGRFPQLTAIGCEIVPTIWLLGWIRTRLRQPSIHFRLRDAMSLDLRDADVLFLYLTPSILGKFEGKFDRELRSGTTVITHAFRFPNRTPLRTIEIRRGRGLVHLHVYGW